MTKVVFILGLCGVGKSTYGRTLPGKLFDEGVGFVEESTRQFFDALKRGDDCTVIEAAFCRKNAREWIIAWIGREAPGTGIEWVCFENDLARANENCRLRKDKGQAEGHVDINGRLSPDYTYPPGAQVRPIFRVT